MSEKKLTPLQEHIAWLNEQIKENRTAYRSALIEAKEHAESKLEKEREATIEFAYKCRNVMAADEFAISKWYDETFKTKER